MAKLDKRVIANIVVAGNGMTTLGGSSRGLSNREDRARFHALRAGAQAIAIGGSTFRSEPYSNLSLPLYVASRRIHPENSKAKFFNLSPAELVLLASKEIDGTLLVEGGVNFLGELITKQLIDELHITRVSKAGDAFQFDDSTLKRWYFLANAEQTQSARFELWSPRNS